MKNLDLLPTVNREISMTVEASNSFSVGFMIIDYTIRNITLILYSE